MVAVSVLDLAQVNQGSDVRTALQRSIATAQHVERLGFHRFWLAEHHGMPGIASAATAVVMSQVLAATEHIRVGAGGIMLPNHSPLVIAEQFGTLEALYPGRVDLGLGRAPGSGPLTARALRRDAVQAAERFPDDVQELLMYFSGVKGPIRAIPGEGANVPVWILGSSTFGARLAAKLGLPYAFASHFAPAMLNEAIEQYRQRFMPAPDGEASRLMLAINVFAADTVEDAKRLSTSTQQAFLALRRGQPVTLPPPVDRVTLSLQERAVLSQVLTCTAVGDPETVRTQLQRFAEQTGADELIVVSQIYDPDARLRSFELLAEAVADLGWLNATHVPNPQLRQDSA